MAVGVTSKVHMSGWVMKTNRVLHPEFEEEEVAEAGLEADESTVVMRLIEVEEGGGGPREVLPQEQLAGGKDENESVGGDHGQNEPGVVKELYEEIGEREAKSVSKVVRKEPHGFRSGASRSLTFAREMNFVALGDRESREALLHVGLRQGAANMVPVQEPLDERSGGSHLSLPSGRRTETLSATTSHRHSKLRRAIVREEEMGRKEDRSRGEANAAATAL